MPPRSRSSEPTPPPLPDPRLHQPTDPDSEDRPLPTDTADDLVVKALRANARHSARSAMMLGIVHDKQIALADRMTALEVRIAPIAQQAVTAQGVAADAKKFLDSKAGERVTLAVFGLVMILLNQALPQLYAVMVAK